MDWLLLLLLDWPIDCGKEVVAAVEGFDENCCCCIGSDVNCGEDCGNVEVAARDDKPCWANGTCLFCGNNWAVVAAGNEFENVLLLAVLSWFWNNNDDEEDIDDDGENEFVLIAALFADISADAFVWAIKFEPIDGLTGNGDGDNDEEADLAAPFCCKLLFKSAFFGNWSTELNGGGLVNALDKVIEFNCGCILGLSIDNGEFEVGVDTWWSNVGGLAIPSILTWLFVFVFVLLLFNVAIKLNLGHFNYYYY